MGECSRVPVIRAPLFYLRLGALVLMAFLAEACIASTAPQSFSTASQPFQVGQVMAVSTGRPVDFQNWLEGLADYNVIYLGEEHHNAAHIQAALTVLNAILDRKHRVVLLMEMFGWDGQDALDRYEADPTYSREAFLADVGWERNWGGKFEDYEPLVNFIRQNKQFLGALNPPKSLVRTVAARGLAQALSDPDMIKWGMNNQLLVDDQEYRELIVGQLQRCHGGLDEVGYRKMYEASLFRDEGMAKTVANWVQQWGPVVSYTGGGHVQYGLPVPNRVQRIRDAIYPGVKQVTIYLHSYDPAQRTDIEDVIKGHIADFVWLTSPSAQGPPRRCR